MIDPLPLKDRIRPYASRIAKVIVTAGATWLLVHYQIDMPPALRSIFEELIGAGLAAATLGLATHFAIATKLNPDDAATPHAAAVGKAKQNQRKRERVLTERIKKSGANAPFFRDPEYPNAPPGAPQHRPEQPESD